MSYVRDKFRQKAKSLRLIMAFTFACSFLWADFSFADSWSCTPPPNEATKAVIDRYPSQYNLLSKNDHIVRPVESSLERRLGFKSRLVSCRGSSCRISEELIKFIGRRNIDIPANNIQMSICSAHNSDCGVNSCKGEYPENYDVIYAWKGGSMRLRLEISKNDDKLSIDEVLEDNFAPDPVYKDYYVRIIGVTKNSRLTIEISSYSK